MGRATDERTDLFNLGLLLFEMLTGRAPFDGSFTDRHHLLMTADVPPLARRRPDLVFPSELEALVSRLLMRERERRVASAEEVLQRLAALEPEARAAP